VARIADFQSAVSRNCILPGAGIFETLATARRAADCKSAIRQIENLRYGAGAFAALLLLFTGCQTLPPLPAVNLKEPGWKVHQGQAVWRRARSAPEIAGEILVATRADGRSFVQFTKAPFPFVTAQTTPEGWEVTAPAQNRRYSGHGQPPARILLLVLPRALAGQPLAENFSWRSDSNGWRLENRKTGESLEGYLGNGVVE